MNTLICKNELLEKYIQVALITFICQLFKALGLYFFIYKMKLMIVLSLGAVVKFKESIPYTCNPLPVAL